MRFSLFIKVTFLLLVYNFTGKTQNVFDTTSWNDFVCHQGNYRMKYPTIYYKKYDCELLYKISGNEKKYPLSCSREIYFPGGKDYLNKRNVENYREWIEWRARMLFAADGTEGSEYGDSVAKNISFTNKYGVNGNVLYIYVTHTKYNTKKETKSRRIEGPVYVFKQNQDIETKDPALFFIQRDDQIDNDDKKIVQLMMDTFNFIEK